MVRALITALLCGVACCAAAAKEAVGSGKESSGHVVTFHQIVRMPASSLGDAELTVDLCPPLPADMQKQGETDVQPVRSDEGAVEGVRCVTPVWEPMPPPADVSAFSAATAPPPATVAQGNLLYPQNWLNPNTSYAATFAEDPSNTPGMCVGYEFDGSGSLACVDGWTHHGGGSGSCGGGQGLPRATFSLPEASALELNVMNLTYANRKAFLVISKEPVVRMDNRDPHDQNEATVSLTVRRTDLMLRSSLEYVSAGHTASAKNVTIYTADNRTHVFCGGTAVEVPSLLGAGPYYIHVGSDFGNFGGDINITFTSLRVVDAPPHIPPAPPPAPPAPPAAVPTTLPNQLYPGLWYNPASFQQWPYSPTTYLQTPDPGRAAHPPIFDGEGGMHFRRNSSGWYCGYHPRYVHQVAEGDTIHASFLWTNTAGAIILSTSASGAVGRCGAMSYPPYADPPFSSVAFGWSDGNKRINAADSGRGHPCGLSSPSTVNVTIHVTASTVFFSDDQCGTLTLGDHGMGPGPYYLFIAPSVDLYPSYTTNFTFLSVETAAGTPTPAATLSPTALSTSPTAASPPTASPTTASPTTLSPTTPPASPSSWLCQDSECQTGGCSNCNPNGGMCAACRGLEDVFSLCAPCANCVLCARCFNADCYDPVPPCVWNNCDPATTRLPRTCGELEAMLSTGCFSTCTAEETAMLRMFYAEVVRNDSMASCPALDPPVPYEEHRVLLSEIMDAKQRLVEARGLANQCRHKLQRMPGYIDEKCQVCQIRYHHKDVSSPTDFSNLTSACRQYKDNSCCTAVTAMNVHNDVLYGDDYRWDRCGTLSPRCQAHFVNEACLYECDVNAGKWRMYETCDDADGVNGWQLLGMPIKASLCDSFYEDCKDDLFCVTAESKSFFALPTCDIATQCQKFSDIYADGREMCELLWDNTFVYETDEADAYTWSFGEGEENPNNRVLRYKLYPPNCPGHLADRSLCNSNPPTTAPTTRSP